ELRWLLNGQITRLRTFENLIDVRRRTTPQVGEIRAVGDEKAFFGPLPRGADASRVLHAPKLARARRERNDVVQDPGDARNTGNRLLRRSALLLGADASAEGDVPVSARDEDLLAPGHGIGEECSLRLCRHAQIV